MAQYWVVEEDPSKNKSLEQRLAGPFASESEASRVRSQIQQQIMDQVTQMMQGYRPVDPTSVESLRNAPPLAESMQQAQAQFDLSARMLRIKVMKG